MDSFDSPHLTRSGGCSIKDVDLRVGTDVVRHPVCEGPESRRISGLEYTMRIGASFSIDHCEPILVCVEEFIRGKKIFVPVPAHRQRALTGGT